MWVTASPHCCWSISHAVIQHTTMAAASSCMQLTWHSTSALTKAPPGRQCAKQCITHMAANSFTCLSSCMPELRKAVPQQPSPLLSSLQLQRAAVSPRVCAAATCYYLMCTLASLCLAQHPPLASRLQNVQGPGKAKSLMVWSQSLKLLQGPVATNTHVFTKWRCFAANGAHKLHMHPYCRKSMLLCKLTGRVCWLCRLGYKH